MGRRVTHGENTFAKYISDRGWDPEYVKNFLTVQLKKIQINKWANDLHIHFVR